MVQAVAAKDGNRLPWLEPYRAPAKSKTSWIAPLAAALAVMLAGLGTLAFLRETPEPVAVPAPRAEVELPSPQSLAPESPTVAIKTEEAAPQTATAPVRHMVAAPRRANRQYRRRIVTAVPARDAYEIVLSEQIGNAMLAPAPPVIQPAPPPPLPPRPAVNPAATVVRGKTIQLGVYLTSRQAEIAWQRAIRDYTFLVTMPKNISEVRWGPNGKRYYRLQIGTPSKRHAKQLCGNLRSTGRSCTVA